MAYFCYTCEEAFDTPVSRTECPHCKSGDFVQQGLVPELPEKHIPSSLREEEKKPKQVMYAIGQEYILEEHATVEYGMWNGPNPSLEEMLEVIGRDDISVIIRFNTDGSNEILYRWNDSKECWQREL